MALLASILRRFLDNRILWAYIALPALLVAFTGANAQVSDTGPGDVPGQPQKTVVHLYFSDKDEAFLQSEDRVVVAPQDPIPLATLILDLLIKGPRTELVKTIPDSTRVRALFLKPEGIAYVDLTAEMSENHPGGVKTEIMTIYSLVNTLVLNVPEIRSVQILIEGREAPTLAGHVDIRFPFNADMLLIR